jgi:hypothetical protein
MCRAETGQSDKFYQQRMGHWTRRGFLLFPLPFGTDIDQNKEITL